MKRATFVAGTADDAVHPLHRRIVRGTVVTRIELLTWGPRNSVRTLAWMDGDRDAARAVFDAVDDSTAVELVAGDGGVYAFVHRREYRFDPAVLELVEESRVVFLPPVTFLETGAVRFEAVGEAEHLSAFHDELADLLDVRVTEVHDFHRMSTAASPTDRQREALAEAVAVGYYDVPRTGTVEDVATRLGCASSTAGELLRRAESTVLTAFVNSGRR